jgi:hypothetical protein
VFPASESVIAFLRVYQGGKSAVVPVDVRVQIVDASMRTVAEEPARLEAARFQSGRSADCQFDLQRSRFTEGEYLVTVEARAANSSARREVRLRVQANQP